MLMQPTLPSSCARAATAEEARYRIDAPIGDRSARVVALDDGAATLIRRLAHRPWHGARFYTLVAERSPLDRHAGGRGDSAIESAIEPVAAPGPDGGVPGVPQMDMPQMDMPLHRTSGGTAALIAELVDADVVLMVATGRGSPEAASIIGAACAQRGIMTAGVVLGEYYQVADTITALRPHARVLLVSHDNDDVGELLSAIRA